jgi:uncharacterized repeat protein (TIGR03987 family)
MPAIEILSITTITLALILYSTGIWAERVTRYLKSWHLFFFWSGFAFDITGTILMHLMADGPFNIVEPHTLTGQLALWLMLAHAIWATIVVRKNHELMKRKFHRYSLFVWFIWLIPYFGGMILAMR